MHARVCGNRTVESARHAAFTAFTPAISNHQLQMRHYIHRYVLRIDAHRCSPVVHWLLLRTQPSAAVILSPHLLAPAWPHFPEEIDLHVSETPTRSPNSAEVALITQARLQAELACWLACPSQCRVGEPSLPMRLAACGRTAHRMQHMCHFIYT